MKEQYINVHKALSANAKDAERLGETIKQKRARTEEKLGQKPLYISEPFMWQEQPYETKLQAATWMGEIITNVFGEGYPLPNKYAEFNLQGIEDGSILPYFGLVEDNKSLTPVVASALVLGKDGFAELGRSARKTDYPNFDGGSVTMERVHDWLRNKHRLLEVAHTLNSDIRAAEAHEHTPSSGPVQNLILGKLGMRIKAVAPLYDVNGLEPFLSVSRPRDLEKVRQINKEKTIFTPPGDHTEFLKTIWEHQLDQPLQLATTDAKESTLRYAAVNDNGRNMYGSMELITEHDRDKSERANKKVLPLKEAAKMIEKTSPSVVAKIPAETPESAWTQQALLQEGYTICGIEPAREEEYLTTKINNTKKQEVASYSSPVTIYMAKLGERVTKGEIPLANPYFPSPEDAGGVDLHGEKLRAMLYEVSEKISNV